MSLKIGGLFDRLLMRHALRRWRAVAAGAERVDLATLRAMRGSARQTRREIDRLLAFLHALTDPRVFDLRNDVPARVPSGLPLAD